METNTPQVEESPVPVQTVEDVRAQLLAKQAEAQAQQELVAAQLRQLDNKAIIDPVITALQTYDPAQIAPAITALLTNTTLFPAPEKVRKARVVRTEAEKAADKENKEIRTQARSALKITAKGRLDKDTQVKFDAKVKEITEKRAAKAAK